MDQPWHAVDVTARACDMGKPVRVTVNSRKTNGSDARGSMKTKCLVSAGNKVLHWPWRRFVKGAPSYFSILTQTPLGNFVR